MKAISEGKSQPLPTNEAEEVLKEFYAMMADQKNREVMERLSKK